MKKIVASLGIMILIVTASMAQKFAYVDSDYILKKIPAYEAAQAQIDELAVEYQKEIETVYAEIDKMYKDFQAEKVLLTEEMKTKREDEIINKEKEAKEMQKKRFSPTSGDLFKKRQELVKPLQDEVFNAVKQMAEEGGYAIIFDTSSGSANILFTDPKYDKSDEILKKLGYKN
ncbi:MAG: OmpH family outer membrane protein [Bacteroidales bacterium]|nr:OmpH family outer membrane protein [Bacteroidales bacterium]